MWLLSELNGTISGFYPNTSQQTSNRAHLSWTQVTFLFECSRTRNVGAGKHLVEFLKNENINAITVKLKRLNIHFLKSISLSIIVSKKYDNSLSKLSELCPGFTALQCLSGHSITAQTALVRLITSDYCCLHASFLSLGLLRPDLSVCRFVGGMNVGSSRISCEPDCVAGSGSLV